MSIRLFSYKLTHDAGFAPNPFHGACTLATCKPLIRRYKRVGDWLAGFTSTKLNGDVVGVERLVYLMQVAEKIPLATFHADPRFSAKIPHESSGRRIMTVGDNVYAERDGGLIQLPNRSHSDLHIAKDTSGVNALVGTVFAYFGSEPLVIPDDVRPVVPRGQAGHGVRTKDIVRAQLFVDFVISHGCGVHAAPTRWPPGDTSWQELA